MTSVLNTNHFGNFEFNLNSIDFWLNNIYHLLITPHYLLWILNQSRNETAWMWHVGGLNKEIDQDCPTVLFWDVYELKVKVINRYHYIKI